MVNLLYAVCSYSCALVLLILWMGIRSNLEKTDAVDDAFVKLTLWTVIFCLVDGTWGVYASAAVMNDTMLVIMSTLFHASASFTPLMWLNFVLIFLGDVRHARVYRTVFSVVFVFEIALLCVNVANGIIFYVDADGVYCSGSLRHVLFYLQYAAYIAIALASTAKYFALKVNPSSALTQRSYRAVMMFVVAPICTGIFQLLFPDAPAYSIGYTLGCCIIFAFVVTDMMQKRIKEQALAEASNEAKSSFLFNMSHDIRTPMNAIIGFTNMALKNVDDPQKVIEYLGKVETSSAHLLELINDVLDMARVESGEVTLSEEPLDLRETVANLMSIAREISGADELTLEAQCDELENPCVHADQLRLNQVLLNVLSNAVKYTKEGGSVEFTVRECVWEDDEDAAFATYEFIVRDTGIGMSPDMVAKMFESFTRAETATVSGIQGTGLGMSITKQLVELMGGSIDVESELGVGTTVTVRLRLRIAGENEVPHGRGRAFVDATSLEGRRVLLVEDNEFNREIALDILEDAGLVVDEAEDGDVAVDVVQSHAPDYFDFVLMDVQMPRMNGYDATRAIRALQNADYTQLPIVAMTANAFAQDKARALEAGMNAHLAKPIVIPDLLRTLIRFEHEREHAADAGRDGAADASTANAASADAGAVSGDAVSTQSDSTLEPHSIAPYSAHESGIMLDDPASAS